MNETIRLGTFRGIHIGLNWSLLAIFALITVSLSAGRFPSAHPGHPEGAYLLAGLATAALFFASILAHELGHAVVAQRNGLEVEGITLWLFGGVARLGGEAQDAASEFRIAAVGPAVSLVIAAAAGVAAAALDASGAPELVVGAAVWLALINTLLAVFNLAPAAPLDGGRILRAFLWWRHGDPLRATRTASRAGRVFGAFLVAIGLLEFALGAGIGGLWLMLIGWFLVNAARAEESAAALRSSLRGLVVREVMTPDPVAVPADITVEQLVDRYLLRHRFSAFPVGPSPDAISGVVTLDRIRTVPPDQRGTVTIADIAIPAGEVTVAPDDPVERALPFVHRGSRALVFDRGRLVGILSPTDITRLVERDALRPPGDRQLT
jgi:Zn-dependent protease/CBS domain-containing protein